MHNLRVRAGEEWMLAGTFLSELNEGYADGEGITRALFYKTILPVIEQQDGAKKDGRYLFVRANLLQPWKRYANYRHQMVSSGLWIARRKWSVEDFTLANASAGSLAPVAETATAVAV